VVKASVVEIMAILSAHLYGQSRCRAWRTDTPSRSKLLSA
jgi:hypothetical protein